jgi:hypothetical protein
VEDRGPNSRLLLGLRMWFGDCLDNYYLTLLCVSHLNGGPTLDWSLIQPGLIAAGCDVVIFLDCCYAGQAARPHSQGRVELLAATDKDQWTVLGAVTQYQSFTHALIKEMQNILRAEKSVSIPSLQRRMAASDSGLARQPFYVALSDDSAGKILLQR